LFRMSSSRLVTRWLLSKRIDSCRSFDGGLMRVRGHDPFRGDNSVLAGCLEEITVPGRSAGQRRSQGQQPLLHEVLNPVVDRTQQGGSPSQLERR
jgi:hypothetical protein